MIEWIQLVSRFLGYSGKDFLKAIETAREKRAYQKDSEWLEQESVYASKEKVRELIYKYYGLVDEYSDLKTFGAKVNDSIVNTTIYSTKEYAQMGTPPLDVHVELQSDFSNILPPIPKSVKAYAPIIVERFDRMKIKIWNHPTYRLLSIGNAYNFEMKFSQTGFLDYRFSSALARDEIKDALIAKRGNISAVLDDAPSVLPIRADYLPNISSLVDFSSRICAGGVLIMFALARGEPHNDFCFPVQRRASNISDGRGSFALVPQAFHQPGVGLPDEVHFYWTAYREIFEELFEGEEVEKENHHLIHDWYFDVSQPMQYFREHEGAFDEKLVGFGIDANSGNYLLPIVFLVRDTWYWKTFSQEMKKNWEIANIEWISTKDQNRIVEILKYGNWTNESLYGLITGLNYLKRTEPRKVDLPDIEFIFGS